MSGLMYFFWSVALILLLIFIWFYLAPYIKRKFTMWVVARTLKRLAKKYPNIPELRDAAQLAKEVNKNEEL